MQSLHITAIPSMISGGIRVGQLAARVEHGVQGRDVHPLLAAARTLGGGLRHLLRHRARPLIGSSAVLSAQCAPNAQLEPGASAARAPRGGRQFGESRPPPPVRPLVDAATAPRQAAMRLTSPTWIGANPAEFGECARIDTSMLGRWDTIPPDLDRRSIRAGLGTAPTDPDPKRFLPRSDPLLTVRSTRCA